MATTEDGYIDMTGFRTDSTPIWMQPAESSSQMTLASDYRDKAPGTGFLDDLYESLQVNVGGHSLAWLGADAGESGETSYDTFQAGWGNVSGDSGETPQAKDSDQQSSGQKFLDSVTGGIKKSWDKDPSEILKLGFGAIGGAYRDQEVKRAAALRRQQELEDRAAFNESVKGLRQARKGIIQRALKRTDGSVVFDAHGNLIKG